MFDVKPITSPHPLDCGPTCLQMLLKYYNIDSSLSDLLRECNINLTGCSAKDIINAGKNYGINLKAYQMSMEELLKQDRPAIIWWKYNHFCIFCGLGDNNRIIIINPDKGRFGIPRDSFSVYYSGVSIFNGEPQDLPKEITLEDKIDALMDYMGVEEKIENNTVVIEKTTE